MLALLGFILGILVSSFRSKRRLEAENAALRNKVRVLRRRCAAGFGSARSDHMHGLADCIINTSAFRFLVHTAVVSVPAGEAH